jgi:hypothetical protein
MHQLNIEPLGAEVNTSGQVYVPFPTKAPNIWETLRLIHCFRVLVVQNLAPAKD